MSTRCAATIDDVRGDADDGGVGRHVVEDDGARADAGVFADGDVAEDVGVVADEDAVADGGVALAVALAGSAQGDALIEGDVAADDGGFADDDAGGVVDEEAAAEQRAGMDVDAGEEAGDLRENARGETQVGAPERVARRDGTTPPRGRGSRGRLQATSAQRDRAPGRSGCLRACVRRIP